MSPADEDDRLTRLGARIDAAREAREPKRSRLRDEATAGSMAWRMVTELVVGVLVGGAMGWGLDSLFGTAPIFLIVMGGFGFAAGIRLVLRAADQMREKHRAGGAPDGADGTGRSGGDETGGQHGGDGPGR